ncbi:MAG: DUF1302 domain-containing protein [Xanthomonadales bacterium]|nr:DUF1302 domain-containing protein [Xanthomonadales bacterium]
MNEKLNPSLRRLRPLPATRPKPLAIALAALLAAPGASAFEFQRGELSGSWDTTISYGFGVRMARPDPNQRGKGNIQPTLNGVPIATLPASTTVNLPGRYSANGDDGNFKYDKHDLISNTFKLTTEFALNWRDYGLFLRGTSFYDFENQKRDDLTRLAKQRVGRRTQLLDAFVFGKFYPDEKEVNLRIGRQVVSWGESTFITGGINVINAVDVSALRLAGSELKEAFLPMDMVFASVQLSESLSVEGLYMLEWEEIEPDPAGTYWSTNDFATRGGTYAMLNFGLVPQPVRNPERYFDVCFRGAPSDTGLPASLVQLGCSASVPRAPDRKARDSGQWGLALRYFAPELNDTEFGLYFLKYHSRLPVISGQSLTSTDLRTGRVIVEYPEDIRLWGFSFNTMLPGGWALQGEYSWRDNQPLQIDDVEILFAALSPLNALIPQPGLRFVSQLGTVGLGQYVQGYERHEVGQFQFTLTKVFGPGNFLAADQIAFVTEAGITRVFDLPPPSVLRYQGDGTDTGGGPDALTGGNLRNPVTQVGGFPTRSSWGYRTVVRADYNNVWNTPVNLSPRIAFNHDVNGISPGPGGNFIQGRKALTLGAEANYLNKWVFDLSYTNFFGGRSFNLIQDRDFAAFSVRYLF